MQSLEKLISNVPLVQLNWFYDNQVFSLLEKFNIGGSVKVKTVYQIFKEAVAKGTLDKSKIILEASSGNTAISLAYLAEIFEVQVEIILPQSTDPCKKRLIKSYGAKITEVDGITDDCIKLRDEIAAQNPGKYFLPDQFNNYANLNAHYELTGPYLEKKLGQLDFWCAGLGTSGTLLGTAKYLKEKNPNIKIIGVNPIDKVEGLRNFKTSQTRIDFYQEYKYLIDEVIDVQFDPDAIVGVQDYLQEGYFVGISSGAILSGLKKYLADKKWLKGVVIAPDGGDYYMQTLTEVIDIKKYQGCK